MSKEDILSKLNKYDDLVLLEREYGELLVAVPIQETLSISVRGKCTRTIRYRVDGQAAYYCDIEMVDGRLPNRYEVLSAL